MLTDFKSKPKMRLTLIFALLASFAAILDARTIAGKDVIGFSVII